jgi:signal transduction histidine kinase
MRLAAFIRNDLRQISAEWERFAGSLKPEREFSSLILRDDIVNFLMEIAADMDRAQSAAGQHEKSEGGAKPSQVIDDASTRHVEMRLKMGVSPEQLFSEFRALRATVIRLWLGGSVKFGRDSLHDLIRFNEAIDEIIMATLAKYTEEVAKSRDMFLGILAHDLRSPLSAVLGAAELLSRATGSERRMRFLSLIQRSMGRISLMVTDLIELTRVRLGSGMELHQSSTTIRRVCASAIGEMRAIYRDRILHLECDDEIPGEWDEFKLIQVLSNLLGNAIQHGSAGSPITLSARSTEDGVEFSVHNEGRAIPTDVIPRLFDSFSQVGIAGKSSDEFSTSIGLGLYIAKEIVELHRGAIEVQSSNETGTDFIVRLPSAH